jgi:hypothetical protein
MIEKIGCLHTDTHLPSFAEGNRLDKGHRDTRRPASYYASDSRVSKTADGIVRYTTRYCEGVGIPISMFQWLT